MSDSPKQKAADLYLATLTRLCPTSTRVEMRDEKGVCFFDFFDLISRKTKRLFRLAANKEDRFFLAREQDAVIPAHLQNSITSSTCLHSTDRFALVQIMLYSMYPRPETKLDNVFSHPINFLDLDRKTTVQLLNQDAIAFVEQGQGFESAGILRVEQSQKVRLFPFAKDFSKETGESVINIDGETLMEAIVRYGFKNGIPLSPRARQFAGARLLI